MANSKIIFNGEVLIDLTSDSVTAANLLTGAQAHGRKWRGGCGCMYL